MRRSVLAVVTGFVVIFVLAMASDLVVRAAFPTAFDATGRTDSVPILLLTIVDVGVVATFGCWLTARMAPSNPMRHALVLGVLGLVFSIFGSIQAWNTAPTWYHVTSLLLVMVWAWLGGWIRERQLGVAGAGAPAIAG